MTLDTALACAVAIMSYGGPVLPVNYIPEKHPEYLGLTRLIDVDGQPEVVVWASPKKPWVQLHESCHVIQLSRGDRAAPGEFLEDAECDAVQMHWQSCEGMRR